MTLDRRLAIIPLRTCLQFILVGILAAGGASLLAFAVTLPNDPATARVVEFVGRVPRAMAVSFLPAGALALWLLPAPGELLRKKWDPQEPALPASVVVLLLGLAAMTAWQAPFLIGWWNENEVLLDLLVGKRPDPMGFWIIPAAVLFLRPILANLACVVFLVTAMLVPIVRSGAALRTLAACVSMQGALVLGSVLVHEAVVETARDVIASLGASPADAASVDVTGSIDPQLAMGRSAIERIGWIFCGYLLVLLLAWRLSRPRIEPQPVLPGVPTPAAPAVTSAARVTSATGQVFEEPMYVVRARTTGIGTLWRRRSDGYEIGTIPPRRDQRFSFSWQTGRIRREPDGPDLLEIREQDTGWFSRASFTVTELATGRELARMNPVGDDWELTDALGQPLALVIRGDKRPGHCRFIARVGGREVCRFTWVRAAIDIRAAELEIEFPPVAGSLFDRSLAIAMGPLLEEQARRANARYYR